VTPHRPSNIAASVRQRLLNQARSEKRPFQEFLQYFAMERFLYRLSQSEHARAFTLKGALMLRVWHAPAMRPTMDIDFLGTARNDVESITAQFQEILRTDVEPDGLVFDPATLSAKRITEDADYEGIRIRFRGQLDSARVNMQIDIGFGDVVFPAPEPCELPTLLDFPVPALWGYSRESAIAEKFEAIIKLGALNSRMKDFYDVWLLSRSFEFDGKNLSWAIKRTFERRGTALTDDTVAFLPDFSLNKQAQWNAFRKRLREEDTIADFSVVTLEIGAFLFPVVEALLLSGPLPGTWPASGPWSLRGTE
jgi:hypothetical protein